MLTRLVHTSKSPFELFMLFAIMLSGLIGLLSPGRSANAVNHVLPLWGQYVWYGGLLMSGLLSTVGALTNRLWSLFAERGGLMMLGALCIAYPAAILVVVGLSAFFAGAIVLGLAAACFVRSRQITIDIRHVLEDRP